MDLTRRDLLRLGGAAAAIGVTSPLWVRLGALASEFDASVAPRPGDRKLLVVLLEGGNDGLNTVVPYGLADYYRQRPGLAIPQSKVLPLPGTQEVGLHPNLKTIQALYQQHRVAIVQGVGYDNPDLSHFGSMDVWQTGSPDHQLSTGWLGRYLDATPDHASVVRAASIGYAVPRALVGDTPDVVSLESFGSFRFADGLDSNPSSEAYRLHQAFLAASSPGQPSGDPTADALLNANRMTVAAVRAVNTLGDATQPPPETLADRVGMAMTLLSSSLGVEIAFVSLGSFDDHAYEESSHDSLLAEVDDAVRRFHDMAAATGQAGSYLMFTFSEFGRRVAQNGSGGTDHGTAAPLFAVGERVHGGLYGAQPALDRAHLDTNGNMIRALDFRDVYATVLDRWLKGGESARVLATNARSGVQPVPFLS